MQNLVKEIRKSRRIEVAVAAEISSLLACTTMHMRA
jgi:hypothetical protein